LVTISPAHYIYITIPEQKPQYTEFQNVKTTITFGLLDIKASSKLAEVTCIPLERQIHHCSQCVLQWGWLCQVHNWHRTVFAWRWIQSVAQLVTTAHPLSCYHPSTPLDTNVWTLSPSNYATAIITQQVNGNFIGQKDTKMLNIANVQLCTKHSSDLSTGMMWISSSSSSFFLFFHVNTHTAKSKNQPVHGTKTCKPCIQCHINATDAWFNAPDDGIKQTGVEKFIFNVYIAIYPKRYKTGPQSLSFINSKLHKCHGEAHDICATCASVTKLMTFNHLRWPLQ